MAIGATPIYKVMLVQCYHVKAVIKLISNREIANINVKYCPTVGTQKGVRPT